jgi:hypothetical protein
MAAPQRPEMLFYGALAQKYIVFAPFQRIQVSSKLNSFQLKYKKVLKNMYLSKDYGFQTVWGALSIKQ